uniref:Archaeal coiled-coil protein n=2 Tax=environmental samples TaxID=68359 RepID=A0A075GYP3_9EURY|nr:hypothetical protein [uncultured marine group II/III euryarchaeote KM3_196_G04]AIF13047.1 hypothetical protein [uncultured marine group II/III euryarchaeote KM3_59_C08]
MPDVEAGPDDDLRTRLHAMETRLRRMREQRNGHNENARRAADSRDSVQEQSRELRERIKERLDEQKEVRARAKLHQAKRDEIQNQMRELITQRRGKRSDEGTKSVVIQLSETIGEIDRIENRIMTDGSLSLDKENAMLKKLKSLIAKRDELMPAAEEFQVIEIDLGDMEGSIQLLRAEADSEHKAMLDANKEADTIWEEVKPMLEERDFLRAEGDRLHNAFVSSREAADGIHSQIKVLLDQVNEIRDELKAQREERERLIREHNQSVRDALKTPDEDEELASSLADELLEKGSITLGGTRTVDDPKPHRGKKRKRSRKIGTRRGKRD